MHALVPILLSAGLCLVSIFVAGWALRLRRKRSLSRKRSPLTADLLRPPGQRIQEQINTLRNEVDGHIFTLMLVPFLILTVHLSQPHIGQWNESVSRIVVMALIFIAVVGYCTIKLLRLSENLDTLRMGYDAELAVGQELDQLMRQGAAVFHDFPADRFNIDHIVISPVGVFAVETKGRAKPILKNGVAAQVEYDGKTLKFPTRIETEPIAQAERQAKWLRDWLKKAVGEPVAVRPVLAIPGWFVKRTSRGSVNVYSGRELATLISKGGFDSIPDDKMQRIVHQVEQRCRNIAPTFNSVPKE